MKQTKQLTAIIEREGDGYVSLCSEGGDFQIKKYPIFSCG